MARQQRVQLSGNPSHLRWEVYSWKIRTLVLLFMGIWGAVGPTVYSLSDRLAVVRLVGIGAAANLLLWITLRRHAHRAISFAVLWFDLFIAYYAIYFTGGLESPLFIVLLIPLMTAAILFGPVGAYLSFLLISVLYGLATITVSPWNVESQMVFLARLFLLGIVALMATYVAQEEKHRTFELHSMMRVSRTIARVSELPTALRELVGAIRDILDVEKVLFMLYDSDTDMLIAQEPACGLTAEQVMAARLPRGVGISWQVFESGESLLINNAARDPRTAKALVEIHGTKSLLTVALKVRNECIGVLHTMNRRDGAPFSERDRDLLELLAGEAALILDHARLHRAMSQERGTLNAVLHSIRSGVVVTDPQGRIILVNDMAAHFIGGTEQMLLQQPVGQAISEPRMRDFFRRALEAKEHLTEEVKLQTFGETILRVDSSPVVADTGERLGRVTILTDITEWKNLDRLKTEFIATVSHELRTPLTSIKAYTATLLRNKNFDEATQSAFLKVINEQCDRLARLINDILDIARLERGEKLRVDYSQVDLPSLIAKVIKSEEVFAQRQVFEVRVDDSVRSFESDEQHLERVLANLVNNAIKYSPAGSRITISAVPVPADEDSILLSVTDEGIGIPLHRQEAIFHKFYQLDGHHNRVRGGSGLGLYLVQHLVLALGGKIWVDSEPNKGATFNVQLPRRPPVKRRAEESQTVMTTAT